MIFFKDKTLFNFSYAGKAFSELECSVEKEETDGILTRVYTLPDGLKITNTLYKKGMAYEWVSSFENTSDRPSEVITELFDADISLPMSLEKTKPFVSYQDNFKDVTAVWAPKGSVWSFDEFYSFADRKIENSFEGHLYAGDKKTYSTSGGRSSQEQAPFFNVHKDGKGYIFAIGWTGQWNCEISRSEDAVMIKSKIEDTEFRLLPGEKIRTSSFVLMPYEGSVEKSQNLWRKTVKEHFSLIGKEGRPEYGPLCAGVWGGMKTSSVLYRIDTIKKAEIPFEFIWMDAGWYGADTQPTPNEYEGDWWERSGDWTVSPLIHPNGLKDVSKAVHDAGMKFLLWVEPERVKPRAPIAKEHPEYFTPSPYSWTDDLLLDLGNEEAWNYCYETLSGLIESIGIDCYRQDFNMNPLAYWRQKDAPDRKGISEIKHINGLYRLWDALLERFPSLIIDNCASGGRRIDIETLRRSIPLWRSDYQCPAVPHVSGTQCHHFSFNTWMPFSGTGCGRAYDTYRIRSAYSAAMTTNYTFSETDAFGDDPEKLAWLKERACEYLKVRPYMSEDFYPLTELSDREDIWFASQFDRPDKGDGALLIFRRERSPYPVITLELRAIDPDAEYTFYDVDSEGETLVSGSELLEDGLTVSLDKFESALIFYRKN